MTTQEELIFRVPDISAYPRFSLDRHKPQSRLQNFHALDYEEEMFIDISYCDKSFKALNSNTLGVTLNDFSVLLTNRKGSTSTPFKDSIGIQPKSQTRQTLGSVVEDSGFNETNVANTFASSCIISSPVIRNKRPREIVCHETNDEDNSIPLPCLSLQDRFENLLSDSDISNDSCDVSLHESQKDASLDIKEIPRKTTSFVASLEKGISNASSGYGSLCSQSSELNYDSLVIPELKLTGNILTEQSLPEQIVPEYNSDLKPDSIINKTVPEDIDAFTENTLCDKSSFSLPSTSTSERIKQLLTKYAPKDPLRLIGRKIGLDKVDIITELYRRDVLPALSRLFYYLEDSDVHTASNVSCEWKHAVKNDVKASVRHTAFSMSKKSTGEEKENAAPKPIEVGESGLTGNKLSGPLRTLQLEGSKSKLPSSDYSSKYQQFVKVASNLKNGETLRKCPKCRGPSLVSAEQERAICVSKQCSYDFCIKCRSPFHGSAECLAGVSKKNRTEAKVGSKKSKAALKRL